MNAAELLFPKPASIRLQAGRIPRPRALAWEGTAIPVWLKRKLVRVCGSAEGDGRARVRMRLAAAGFAPERDAACRAQSYELTADARGDFSIAATSRAGLQHGLITLGQLLSAAGSGATLTPMAIRDAPSFAIRGIQVDLAREFFPPMRYLRNLVDRMVDLKLNTLWLYLENHFRAPGLEDLSPRKGMTPAQAREISAYAAERGVDVVPGANLLSHMEGWFRLERYSDLCDGNGRSYPVLGREEAFRLSARFADELARAFPSRNFHAGLDELLFTGANPEAARQIRRQGKAVYFAKFARRLIRRLQARGKVVWIWDDMVVGKNVDRKEGFQRFAPFALRAIPRKTILTHWYYWTNDDGKHEPIFRRVVRSGRPFAMAPSAQAGHWNSGHFQKAAENQAYLADLGTKHRAVGYICTHWEARLGSSFEASWPFLAMSAGYSWGGVVDWKQESLAFSFALCGSRGSDLVAYLKTLQSVEELLFGCLPGNSRGFREILIVRGPPVFWRTFSPRLNSQDRRAFRILMGRARDQHARLGKKDFLLKEALRLPLTLYQAGFGILENFDRAWASYHAAARMERRRRERDAFVRRVEETLGALRCARAQLADYREALLWLQTTTGHTPYDAYALRQQMRNMDVVARLVRAVVRDGNGLPYFEKLLHLPEVYRNSNLCQLRVQNNFNPIHPDLPWPVRWRRAGRGSVTQDRRRFLNKNCLS